MKSIPKQRGGHRAMSTRIYLAVHNLPQPVHREVAVKLAEAVARKGRTDGFRRLAMLVHKGLLVRCGDRVPHTSGGLIFTHYKTTDKGQRYAANCSEEKFPVRENPPGYGLVRLIW